MADLWRTCGGRQKRVQNVTTMRRSRAAVVVLAAVAVGFVLIGRWWRGPSPEGEAAKYFDRAAPDGRVAVVWDCLPGGRSEPPSDSYWCLVTATQPISPALPGAARVGIGLRTYCFKIPRATYPPWERSDADALPLARVGRYGGCG